MIRTEAEYQSAIKLMEQNRDYDEKLRAAFQARGLTQEQVERGMEPSITFHMSLAEDVEWYENVRRRNFTPIRRISHLGLLLIALRIAKGWSQRELAEKLGVSESAVSRDEHNEYHGITIDRAQRVLDALGETIIASVDDTYTMENRAREMAGIA